MENLDLQKEFGKIWGTLGVLKSKVDTWANSPYSEICPACKKQLKLQNGHIVGVKKPFTNLPCASDLMKLTSIIASIGETGGWELEGGEVFDSNHCNNLAQWLDSLIEEGNETELPY